ncbi:MAG: L,D-transpeptidase [Deltaproteobacteria bacterium]|nr:L,D-transpeptidase [Deltaproteobacteria bacterium]
MKRIVLKRVWLVCALALLWAGCGGNKDEGQNGRQRVAKPVVKSDAGVDHDAEPPPPPPGGRKLTIYKDGVATPSTENEARAQGLTVIDLSNFWVPYIFSEQDAPDAPRLKNDFRPIFRKLANAWHYESRTMAAAREIVEKGVERARNARIFELKQQGLSDEDIKKAMGELKADGGPVDTAQAEAKPVETDGGVPAGGPGDAERFLEVYGIPPSLSVLKRRAQEELTRPCLADVDMDAIRRFDGFVTYTNIPAAEEMAERGRTMDRKMRATMEKLGVTDPLQLPKMPEAKMAESLVNIAVRHEAIAAAQKMLVCEGLFAPGSEKNYHAGGLDWKTHQAISEFERKNRVFGWGFFGKETLDALKRTPAERFYDAFLRVLNERVADAAGIIEDGTAEGLEGEKAVYKDEKGVVHAVPNLVAEDTALVLKHMGLTTPDKVAAFLKGRSDAELDQLFVAVPLPGKPPYYSEKMDLHAVIDRGDIWYDYPFAPDGREKVFPRKRMPMLTLFVRWNGQDIPLAKMNTTVGGWRSELAPDGYEYYKYKNSDVGSRVWKDVIAGPVWLPPETTPLGDMVKSVIYKGREVKVPNYDEFGPWYASAYGLVAGFHMRPVPRRNGETDYWDNGIRTHGSVDYMSILRRHSHGCHRLYNHLAIRLFDYVLRHRPFKRVGEVPAGYSTKFEKDGETYTISLESKGYKYELVEPLPVDVLTGRIRGAQHTPIETYMPKPDEEYGPDAKFLPPGWKTGGADAGPEDTDTAAPKDTKAQVAPAKPAEAKKPAEIKKADKSDRSDKSDKPKK